MGIGRPGRAVTTVEAPATGTTTAEVVGWMTAAQAGDRVAFGRLYARYLDVVMRFIYFRVGGGRQVAEDLTAETFTRALARIGTFTWQGRDPGAWFITIARNLVADHYKSGRVRLEIVSGDPVEAADDVDRGPHAAAEAAEFREVWRQIRPQLTAEQARCLELRFVQGLSIREVGQAMGKEDGAIKALAYRGATRAARLIEAGRGRPRPVIPAPRRPVVTPPATPRPPVTPGRKRWQCRECGGTYVHAYHHPKTCNGWLELLAGP
jgi:RNA polymerase sigma-70 factor (ECF subfamily)